MMLLLKLTVWQRNVPPLWKASLQLRMFLKDIFYPVGGAQYIILLENREQRDSLQKHLKTQGISSMIHYPRGLRMQLALKNAGYKKMDLPNTERVCQVCLSLPMNPYMSNEDVLWYDIKNYFN